MKDGDNLKEMFPLIKKSAVLIVSLLVLIVFIILFNGEWLLISIIAALLILTAGIILISIKIKNKPDGEMFFRNGIRYKDLIETMNEGVIIADSNGVIIFVNDSLCDITGYSSEELIGRRFSDFSVIHEQNKEGRTGTSLPYELTVQKKDGEEIVLAITPSVITGKSGNFSGSMALVRDISKEKIIAGKLSEESRFFQANPAILLRTDSRGTVTFCNPVACSFFGEDPIGKSIDSLARIHLKGDIEKMLSGESFQFEVTGSNAIIMFTAIKTGFGDAVYFYGTDITKLKEADREILRLLQAVEQSKSTIVITDVDEKIIFANKAMEHISGYRISEAMGETPRLFSSGFTSEETYHDLKKTIREGKTWKGEFINRKKDGSLYWESAVITPVMNSEGQIINYVAVKDDITQQKEMEKKLKKAKEEAEKANQLKSVFLANMSHEIRTPMNAILGFINLLMDEEKDPEKKNSMRIIKQSGETLLNLINDILDFSKIEADKMEIVSRPFTVMKVLDHMVSMFKRKAEEKGLEFITEIDKSIPGTIRGDEVRLGQIIINFLSNAFKFTKKGSITLIARYGKGKLSISVKDTGIGIRKEDQKIIFSPFRQIMGTAETASRGTGLGLAISRKLAKLMGGRISVKSTYGKGTTFTLTIPAETVSGESHELSTAGDDKKESLNSMTEGALLNGEKETADEGVVERWIDNFDGEEEIVEVLLMGVKKLPLKVKKLEDAVLKRDRKGIRFIAHELKGMSGNLKMDEVYEISKRMDEEINKNDYSITQIRDLLFRLKGIIAGIPVKYLDEKTERNMVPNLETDFNILLAEDNRINQQLMERILNKMHLSCDVAENGENALKMINEKDYDLVLLDIQMPKLDGPGVLEGIRKNEKLKGLYVIALTANALKGDAEKYLTMGFDDYISKPVDFDRFKEKVYRQVMEKHEREQKVDG
ncbi:MAG: PAS domain S-box protein [Spirochaetes bacterium]|nr:PAS domain S-box protein [Spirochaetota bacterium]